MPSWRIREAQASDAAGIAGVHIRAWETAYRALLSDEVIRSVASRRLALWRGYLSRAHTDEHVLIAADGTHIVGFAYARPSPDEDADANQAELGALYIAPNRWGEGIGSALLAAVLRRLRTDGSASATLWVLAGNTAARNFYERRGWRRDGHERVDAERGARELRYRLELQRR
jgi:GNAT superfamily N-acetyltransferase